MSAEFRKQCAEVPVRSSPRVAACCATILALFAIGCHDSTGPRTGIIQVAIITSGAGRDTTARFSLSVDGGVPFQVRVNEIVTLENLAPGEHRFILSGLTVNCSVAGALNPRTVVLDAGKRVWTEFDVNCAANVGRVRVTTASTGASPDVDGYVVSVSGRMVPISATGTLTVDEVPSGQHVVRLESVARNCTATPTSYTVTISFAATTDVRFDVVCRAVGSLRVTTVTSGVDLDSDGYGLAVQAAGYSRVEPLGSVSAITIDDLAPGDYIVTLQDIEANCDPAGSNPRTVSIGEGAAATTSFEITCAQPTRLAFISDESGNPEVYTTNSNGTGTTRLTNSPQPEFMPAWSPDGQKIAFQSARSGNTQIYVMNADGSHVTQLTPGAPENLHPSWSPDGTRIAFVSQRDGNAEIYVMNADGTGLTRLTTSASGDWSPAWSPDGLRIAFISDRDGPVGHFEIYLLRLAGSVVTRLLPGIAVDGRPAWSPDGERLAFSPRCSSECGIFTVRADGTGMTAVVRDAGASEPAWSPDGKRIAFTQATCDYYYYYDCSYAIAIVKLDGSGYVALPNPSSYNPAWRR